VDAAGGGGRIALEGEHPRRAGEEHDDALEQLAALVVEPLVVLLAGNVPVFGHRYGEREALQSPRAGVLLARHLPHHASIEYGPAPAAAR
jgi:hypothetical protein